MAVSLAYLSAGFGCGWVPPLVKKYKNSTGDFSLTTTDCSLIASLYYAGKEIACLGTPLFMDRFGRNAVFIFSAVCGLLVWLGVLLTKSIPLHFVIRLLFGFSVGTFEITTSVYIGENSSPNLRGVFGTMCIISFYVGELIAFIIGTYLAYQPVAIISAAVALWVLFSNILLREPAQYLLTQGHEERAAKTFFKLRGTAEAANREFEEIKLSLQQQTGFRLSWTLLTDKSLRVVCIINMFMYLTGFPPLNTMSTLVFLPIGNVSPSELTILMGIFQLVSVVVSSTFIERIGRRPMLLSCAVICFIVQLINSIVYYFDELGTPVPLASWLLFICITVYSIVAAAILFPISTVIRGELLSPQLKLFGGCVSVALNSILSFGMATIFLNIAEMFGMKSNFFFFTAMSAAMIVYVYVDLPETKGLTLTQIQRSLNKD